MTTVKISDTLDGDQLTKEWEEYDHYCESMHYGGFYVEWLDREEFFERVKTYEDLVRVQWGCGYLDSYRIKCHEKKFGQSWFDFREKNEDLFGDIQDNLYFKFF